MTGTIPKNAGSTSKIGSQKARALCGNPRRSFHFCGPSGFPLASHGCQGRFPGFTKVSQDRTETRRKVRVQGGLFARTLRNRRSWPVLATASRGDWSVRISNCFCRRFHLSRNDGIASRIVARDPFCSDGYLFPVSVADRQEIMNETELATAF